MWIQEGEYLSKSTHRNKSTLCHIELCMTLYRHETMKQTHGLSGHEIT